MDFLGGYMDSQIGYEGEELYPSARGAMATANRLIRQYKVETAPILAQLNASEYDSSDGDVDNGDVDGDSFDPLSVKFQYVILYGALQIIFMIYVAMNLQEERSQRRYGEECHHFLSFLKYFGYGPYCGILQ